MQPDFQAQKCHFQEEIEKHGHLYMFFPTFHCEINWIEYWWGHVKYFTQQNCHYTWPSLVKTVLHALNEVAPSLLLKYWWKSNYIIPPYQEGLCYGMKKLTDTLYKSHQWVSMAQELV
jgi:hypothetical protein